MFGRDHLGVDARPTIQIDPQAIEKARAGVGEPEGKHAGLEVHTILELAAE